MVVRRCLPKGVEKLACGEMIFTCKVGKERKGLWLFGFEVTPFAL